MTPGGGGLCPAPTVTYKHLIQKPPLAENLRNNRVKLTSKILPPLGLEPRALNLKSSTTTNSADSQF